MALLERLTFGRREALQGVRPRHKVPVPTNAYGMTSNLRHAVNLYRGFRAGARESTAPQAASTPARVRRAITGTAAWPAWEQPSPADLLQLARALSQLVRFLHPDIVAAIVDDNERQRPEWEGALRANGIDPHAYLWEGCATMFPGVRRHVGAAEVADFHQGRRSTVTGALLLDDNHYPKQAWSFVLRGRPFQNFGPTGYQLAHLVDHKAYQNRGAQELVGSAASVMVQAGLPGLFTSAANTAYVSSEFLRPTDFSPLLRNLLQRRAADLYGSFCQLLPSGLSIREPASRDWATSEFTWADPVGTGSYLPLFLDYRRSEMERLMRGVSNPVRDNLEADT